MDNLNKCLCQFGSSKKFIGENRRALVRKWERRWKKQRVFGLHASLILREERKEKLCIDLRRVLQDWLGHLQSSCSSEESQVSKKWASLSTFPVLGYWRGTTHRKHSPMTKRRVDFRAQRPGSLANCAPCSPRSERQTHMWLLQLNKMV